MLLIRHIVAACLFMLAAGLQPVSGGQGRAQTPDVAAAADSSWRIEMTGDTFSLWANNAERLEILNEIACISGASLGTGRALEGRATLSVTHATVEEVLARLLENTALVFAYEPKTGRYRIVDVQGFNSSDSRHNRVDIPSNNAESSSSDAGLSQKIPREPLSIPVAAVGGGNLVSPTDSQGRLLYKPGEVLVQFKPAVPREKVDTLVDALGGKLLSWLSAARLATVKVPPGMPELTAVRAFYASGLVEIAERHVLRYPSVTPDDPLYSDQWAPAVMSAEKAWQFSQGSPDVLIAVVDTGIDYTHPDIAANRYRNAAELNGSSGVDDDANGYIDDIYGWDFADNDALPMDTFGHGTHVAGIAAAVGNNGVGVAGVSWHSKLMALKVQRNGQSFLDGTAIIAALIYAQSMGARIVNCSFGGSGYSQIEYNRLAALGAAGTVAVCAAGNESPAGIDADSFPLYPAAYNLDNIFSVGASTRQDALALYSDFGAQSVDLLAPGSDIRSTLPVSAGGYGYKSGTSMAAPQVSGAIALLWSKKPGLTAAQVKAAIFDSVDPISAAQGKTVTGGRLNIGNALCLAAAIPGDVNCDAGVDLADVIIALQVIAAGTPEFCETCFAAGTDPDGDGRLGTADAINILQRVAEIR
ncbi:MAG: S8 family serine peptidase [Pseudomonadota bacterium]